MMRMQPAPEGVADALPNQGFPFVVRPRETSVPAPSGWPTSTWLPRQPEGEMRCQEP